MRSAVTALAVSVITICMLGAAGAVRVSQPQPTITVPCEVVEWYDGDTGTMRVSLDLRVRLLDCWSPEVHSRDDAEKQRGEAARQHVRDSFPAGSSGVLEIPLSGYDRLDDALTMGRVLGHVWIDGKSVAVEQVKAGHATARKEP